MQGWDQLRLVDSPTCTRPALTVLSILKGALAHAIPAHGVAPHALQQAAQPGVHVVDGGHVAGGQHPRRQRAVHLSQHSEAVKATSHSLAMQFGCAAPGHAQISMVAGVPMPTRGRRAATPPPRTSKLVWEPRCRNSTPSSSAMKDRKASRRE